MIKYEILKQNDNLIIFKNNDEFYKFLINSLFVENENINDINDCFQFSCDIQIYYTSFETMQNILNKNEINDYVICFDVLHEKIYIYDKKRTNIFYINYDNLFCNEFSICSLNETNKLKIITMILNCMLNK